MTHGPDTGSTADLIEAGLRPVFALLQEATTVGESAEPTDLVEVLARGVAAVQEAQPPFLCQQGCFRCCREAVPVITAPEWLVLYRELATWQERDLITLAGITNALYGEQLDALMAATCALRGEPYPGDPTLELQIAGCPLLHRGRCTAYEARPMICRAFGYATASAGGEALPLMCREAIDHLEATFPDDKILLSWEPFEDKLGELNGQGAVGHLPLWIMAQSELGGFLAPPITDPMPWLRRRTPLSDAAIRAYAANRPPTHP